MGKDWYDPVFIAESFRYHDGLWVFEYSDKLYVQLQNWQNARKVVYSILHSAPHLVVTSMISQALYYARDEIQKTPEFFTLTDQQALNFLKKACAKEPRQIVDRLLRWRYLDQVVNFETEFPSERLLALSKRWENRMELSERLGRRCNLYPDEITIYIGADNSGREITVPMYMNGKLHQSNLPKTLSTYRVQVNIAPEKNTDTVRRIAREYVQECIW
jgi:hypothetical protein